MISFTNITAANSTLQILTAINNDWFKGLFGILLLFSLFIIIFMNLSFYGTKENMLFTSFFIAIIAGFMWLAGLVGMFVFIIAIVLAFVALTLSILFGG